jgi:hypothetical protein
MPSRTTRLATLVRKLSPFENFDADQMEFAAPEFFPIVPTSRLWLPRLGVGNDERFANIFRDTWRQIDIRARRLMVAHWRNGQPRYAIQGLWSPTIRLCRSWQFNEWSWRGPRDLGACGSGGHSLYFYAPVVDAMPTKHVGELIAHELAHVIQYATGDLPRPGGTDRTIPRSCDPIENIADEYMEWWGFDPSAIDEWCAENWKWE